MTRFTFVTWDGGGNLAPAIGIAQELVARGNQVRFLGYGAQRAGIEARGFAFSTLRKSGSFDLYGDVPADRRMAAITRNVWACREHLDDVPHDLSEHPADLLVIDFSMQGALAFARQTPMPVAVLAHSTVTGLVPPPESPAGAARMALANQLRSEVGLPTLSRLDDAWTNLFTLVTTIPELDPAAAAAADSVHYVGPIFEQFPEQTWDSPWDPDDSRPLVLVSFSTTRLWDQVGRIRNTLAALSEEPVRILVSAPDASDLPSLPDNATARRFVPHTLVMPSAAATVTHCGHGTVSSSLSHAVPIVGLPNPAADQPFLAARIQELGAGLALAGESGPEAIRIAVRALLRQPSYREAARRLGVAIRDMPGAAGAAVELEDLALSRSEVTSSRSRTAKHS